MKALVLLALGVLVPEAALLPSVGHRVSDDAGDECEESRAGAR
jgi:hypothetical protein